MFLSTVLIAVTFFGGAYVSEILPLVSGYGAKVLCSAVFLGGRNEADVLREELGQKPASFGTFRVDLGDASATGEVFGLGKRKALYREGMGCTLIGKVSEVVLRERRFASTPESSARGIVLETEFNRKGVDYRRIGRAIEDVFSEPNPNRPLRRTRAVIVLHRGRVIAEKYADGFGAQSRFPGWSMAKSVTNALVGILVHGNRLRLTDHSLFEEWKKDGRDAITIAHLLNANSGLRWKEEYTGPSDATRMLFGGEDVSFYARSAPLADPPGMKFVYSSGSTNILASVIRRTVAENYDRFPFKELFHKLGMESAVFEQDGNGTFVGSSFMYASARDWARFGQFYLDDGIVRGERILPEGWVEFTATPAAGAENGEYGAHFWTNVGAPENIDARPYPDVPADAFLARGFEGQALWIIPSARMVVLRLSTQKGDAPDENRFVSELMASVRD